jgi:hypothetical protein
VTAWRLSCSMPKSSARSGSSVSRAFRNALGFRLGSLSVLSGMVYSWVLPCEATAQCGGATASPPESDTCGT